MPRKNPLPQREKEISSRLRQIRAQSGMNKALFATHAGITPARVNHYQTGAARVPFAVAMRICEFANINHTWLATGKGPESPAIRFLDELVSAVPGDMPFSEAYDYVLAPEIQDGMGLAGNAGSKNHSGDRKQSAHSIKSEKVRLNQLIVTEGLGQLPPQLTKAFREALEAACRNFHERHKEEIDCYWNDLNPQNG